MKTYEIVIVDKGKDVKGSFSFAADATEYKAMINGLTGEALEKEFKLAYSAHDLRCRAGAREKVAAERTIVRSGGKDIDIMLVPIAKRVVAINAAFALAAVEGREPRGAYATARTKSLANGEAVEKDGILVAKK